MKRTFTLGALALALVTTAEVARADVPEGLVYSDFDAYFEIESEDEIRNNQPADKGWYLQFDAKLYGDGIDGESGLKYVVKQGRRTLATVMCDARIHQRPEYDFPEGVPGFMHVRHCKDDDQLTKAVGDVTIEVHYIDGADDSETLIRTHHIVVRRFEGVRRADQYYIVHNGEVASSVIHEYWNGQRNPPEARRMSNNYVGLFVWVAEADDNGIQPDADEFERDLKVRCTVDGERVQSSFDPRVRSVRGHMTRVMASWGQGRQNERNQYEFEQFHIVLPITMGEEEHNHLPNAPRLEDHPGQWECQLRRDRKTIRSFRFTVADGHIQPHPEQVAGGVHLPARMHLVPMTIAADSTIETRVNPGDAMRGPFYGVGWATDEGRAIAEGLPTIGEAQLPGEPRARRGRRGRRRGRR